MATQAVLNTDQLAVRRHEKRIADLKKDEARENELRTLRSEVQELKQMFASLSNSTPTLAK
jgi:hypothetical protein